MSDMSPEEMREAAARELFDHDANEGFVEWPEWDSAKNAGKPLYIDRARCALLAARRVRRG